MYLGGGKTIGSTGKYYDELSHILIDQARFECDLVQLLH